MRLCHMVRYNKNTLLSLTQTTDNNNMKSFRSQPLPSVSRPLSCATDFWVAQQQRQQPNLVWGRIQDNGCNFIVEGYKGSDTNQWVQIPCRTLLDAKLHLGDIMDKDLFDFIVDLERYTMNK